MSTTYNLFITLGYENTDFKRELKFSELNSSVVSGIKTAIQNYNSNLSATDKNIFISDDYDIEANKGKLSGIVDAKLEKITETIINLGGNNS